MLGLHAISEQTCQHLLFEVLLEKNMELLFCMWQMGVEIKSIRPLVLGKHTSINLEDIIF